MAEFDAFESAPPQEEDPAAEFLAREQEELAELEGENFTVEGQTDSNTTEPVVVATDADILNEFEKPTDDDTHAAFSPGFSAEAMFDSFGVPIVDSTDAAVDEPVPVQDAYAAVSQVDKLQQEPEKIKRWREEQKQLLQDKDEEAEKKKEEWMEVAKGELTDWYKHRDDQQVKAKANNRESEDVFIKERDECLPGGEWERICRLCDFNPKTARNQKDISRMRSILLHLKQNGLMRA